MDKIATDRTANGQNRDRTKPRPDKTAKGQNCERTKQRPDKTAKGQNSDRTKPRKDKTATEMKITQKHEHRVKRKIFKEKSNNEYFLFRSYQ